MKKLNIILTTKGFVGVDDIVVHEGSCSTTDLCNFESNSLCNYENDQIDDFDWQKGQGNTFANMFSSDVIDVIFF